jgi:hypothetical protein
MTTLLGEAQVRHFQRWDQLLGHYVWPNAVVLDTWEEEVDYINTWIRDRMQWMDQNMHTLRWTGTTNTVSVAWHPRQASLTVHPLPSSGSIFVSLELPVATGGVVVIRDALGREVRRREFHAASSASQGLSFHLRDLPNGLYHAFLHVGGGPVAVTRILLVK